MKTFRLLEAANWTIHSFEIVEAPSYLAVSHAWFDALFPQQLPLSPCFGRNAITETLAKRYPGVKYCWIDSICIDQTSTEDKTEQIPLMGQIFSNATTVLIIITSPINLTQSQVDYGTAALAPALEVWETEEWTDPDVRRYWAHGEGRAKIVQAMKVLARLTKSVWGTRIWTLQEYILAAKILWIGSDLEPISIPDELFVALPGLCDPGIFDITECNGRQIPGSGRGEYELLFSHFAGMAASRVSAIERTRVMELLGNRKATVPVDEVYGIMAAAGVEIEVRAQESRESAWSRWVHAALEAGHLRWLMLPPAILDGKATGTCEAIPFDKRHLLSSASGLDAVVPLSSITVAEGTISLSARPIGPCTILRRLGPIHETVGGFVHRDITLILFADGNWFSAIDVAVAFGAGRYSKRQLLLIAQVLMNNFSRAQNCVQRRNEHNFHPIIHSESASFVWGDFMELQSQSVMHALNFGIGYLIRIQCPTSRSSFLTVLVTNGICPKDELMAFDLNARGLDRRSALLVGQRSIANERGESDASVWHKAGVTIAVGEDYMSGWGNIMLEEISIGGSRCQVCRQMLGSHISLQPLVPRVSKSKRDRTKLIQRLTRERHREKVLERVNRKILGVRLDLRSHNRRRRRNFLLRTL